MLSLDLPSLHFQPLLYRPDGVGHWSGHTPFACDLIQSMRPSVFVELGVYYGESYFACCQSIAEAGLACACCGVDTWGGDLHTGPYGEEVFREVDEFNQRSYGSFSTLLRTSFDDAAQRYAPESIDLLHLDGLHLYEAVRHDVETWLPKLRPGGILLLHDIAVRQGDFGVWRFWAELESRFPTFAFTHSCGLGVALKPGPLPAGGIVEFIFRSRAARPETVRAYYELCAERLESRFNAERCQIRRDVTTQLYWRSEGESFSEERSTRVYHTLRNAESTIRLPIASASEAPLVELRLDLAHSPAVLYLSRVSILDPAGNALWELGLAPVSKDLIPSGVQLLEDGGGQGALAVVTTPDAWMLLPAKAECLGSLPSGSVLELGVSAADPVRVLADCVAELKAATLRADRLHQRLDESEAAARACREAVSTVQRLTAESEEVVRFYNDALGTAQRLVSEREEELRRLKQAEEASERLLSEREAEVRELSKVLDQATQGLRQVEIEREDLRRRFDYIERSFIWQAARPLRRLEHFLRRRRPAQP